jgi:AcrR family transcriptional regulator
MQDIAEAVNLQKASLYYHVNSKQEILVALLDRALDMLIEKMESVLAQPLPPDKKLPLAIRAYLSAMLEHRDLAVILLMEHRSLDTAHHDRHVPRRDRFEQLWRDLMEEGERSGVFSCVDPAMASRALLGVLNWTITWYRPDGPLPPDQIADQFANLFLRGLLTRPDTKLVQEA